MNLRIKKKFQFQLLGKAHISIVSAHWWDVSRVSWAVPWQRLELALLCFFSVALAPGGILLNLLLAIWESWASLVTQPVKNLRAMQETWFDPWVGKIPWRREWQPTPIFLPGEFRGQRSLASYSPWDLRVGHNWLTFTFIDRKECSVDWRSQTFKITDKMVTIWIWHLLLSDADAFQKYEMQPWMCSRHLKPGWGSWESLGCLQRSSHPLQQIITRSTSESKYLMAGLQCITQVCYG